MARKRKKQARYRPPTQAEIIATAKALHRPSGIRPHGGSRAYGGYGLVPKSCIVHAVNLSRKGAEVRFRCADDRGQKEYRSPDGSVSNYPSRFVRGVRTVRLGSVSVGGDGASVHGFMRCKRSGQDIYCRPTD